MKKIWILCLFLVAELFLAVPGSATTIEIPIADVLNLKVDGSGVGGVNVTVTKSFDVIARLISHIEFVDNSVDFNDWGSGAPLVNGIDVFINFSNIETSFLGAGNRVKANHQLGHASAEIILLSDDKNPVGRMIYTKLDFNEFSPVGIDNRTGLLSEFFFQVNDDLTGSNTTHIEVTVEGYQIITPSYFTFPVNEFKPNFVYQLELEDLRFGVGYNLKVNTSETTGASMWINFTARQSDDTVKFTWDLGNYDASTVHFYLYEGNNLLQQESTFVIYNDITTGNNFIIQFALMAGVLIIALMLFFWVADKGQSAFKGKLR